MDEKRRQRKDLSTSEGRKKDGGVLFLLSPSLLVSRQEERPIPIPFFLLQRKFCFWPLGGARYRGEDFLC